MAHRRTLYLDMDGVLVDFDAEFFKRFPHITAEKKDELSSVEFWKLFDGGSNSFFYDAPPFPSIVEHVETIAALCEPHGFCLEILTAIPKLTRYPAAKYEKKAWLEKHGLSHIPFNIGPYAEDKQKHCQKGDILVDDNVLNIVQWNGRGGIGVFHTDFTVTTKYIKKLLEHEAKTKE